MKRKVKVQYVADDSAYRELARWAVRKYKDAHGIADRFYPVSRVVCDESTNTNPSDYISERG